MANDLGPDREPTFNEALRTVFNRYSIDARLGVSDQVLADFIQGLLYGGLLHVLKSTKKSEPEAS